MLLTGLMVTVKPVVGFIAELLLQRSYNHAGAIVGGTDDTAEAKKQIMRECGIHVGFSS
jgi:succinyl-CoA synthetase alpha subunit